MIIERREKPIYVSSPFLPPLSEYTELLQQIWHSKQLTNNGPFVEHLESLLKEKFNVKHVILVSNGTLALQIAIRALGIKGCILTTPFSYVASLSSILYEHCKPIFSDISPDYLDMPSDAIEEIIEQNRVEAILPVHIYGHPCNVEVIQDIANSQNIPVIYDAAHAFGTKYKGRHLAEHGDISIISFHATKIFQTVEGGAIITCDDQLAQKVRAIRNFGQIGHERHTLVGTNAKLSELHAAMGICVLPYLDKIINYNKTLTDHYTELLKNTNLRRPNIRTGTEYNYSFYPVIFEDEAKLLKTLKALNARNIFPRRYFYPNLAELPFAPHAVLKVAADISRSVLCLPLHNDLTIDDLELICELIKENT